MKRLLLAGLAVLPLLLIPARSDAVIVECANCSDIFNQLASYALQAQQKLTAVAQLQTELNSYAQMVRSGLQLPEAIWSTVQDDIMQVRGLANGASLLTGNSGSILSRLQSSQGYANQAAYLPQNIGQQFTMWQQTLGNASNSLGRTLGVQQGQEQNYAALQAAINQHSATAAGQMQAIQAGNELASLTNTQLNQVSVTLTAAAQEQATRDLVAADRQASEDAAMQRLLVHSNIPLTGYRGY